MESLLGGLSVVELSAFVAAPLGGATLAALGAEVIRVDPLGGGIDVDRWPLHEGRSLYWAGLNRGKRSVTVDLRSERGQAVVARLIAEPAAFGKIWNLAGAGVTTQRDIVSEMERQTGTKLKLRVAGKTMLRLIGLFNPFMRELVAMNYLMTDPLLMDDSALQQLIGPVRKTPYVEGIRQTLAAAANTRAPATAA